MIKKSIRSLILDKKSKLGRKDHELFSNIITEKILGSYLYKKSNTIMTFISFSNEVNTHNLIKESISNKKRIIVPITFPKTKEIRPSEISNFDELEIGFYNILTPKKEFVRLINPMEIELTIVPGLAFDRNGYRIGYGGGYYDRFLSLYPDIIKIGIAFDLQIVDSLPREEFDIPVDFIVTEKEIIKCNQEMLDF